MSFTGDTLSFGGVFPVQANTNMLKEDVLQIIFQLTPTDTPFFNQIGEGGVTQPTHEWQKRSLTTRQPNMNTEGAAFTFVDPIVADREANFTQIFRKTIRVSGTAQATALHGVNNVYEDQVAQRMKEFKTDMEHALLLGSRSASGNTAVTRAFDGLIYALSRSSLWSRSSTTTLNEVGMNDLFETIWNNGTEATDLLVGTALKRRINGFSGLVQIPDFGSATAGVRINRNQSDFRLVNTISVYETDFANVRIHISRDLGTAAAGLNNSLFMIAYDRSMYKKAFLRRPFVERLPRIADSDDGYILGEVTLEYGHPNAGGWLLGQ